MSHGLNYEETLLAIRPVFKMTVKQEPPTLSLLENALRAVCCAKCLNWINFSETDTASNDADLQMDEYMHYARFRITI